MDDVSVTPSNYCSVIPGKMKATVVFSLDTEEDRDILQWLNSQPARKRSAAIREALRTYIGGGVTLGDVYQAIRDLERRLGSGSVAVIADDDDLDEPPEAAAALDALAKM